MKKAVLPVIIVIAGFGLAALLISTGPTLEPKPAPAIAPLVRVLEANPSTMQLSSHTHGTVVPRTESELVPEVDGRVVEVSKALVSGGFFSEDDLLLRIESVDYEVALEQALAGEARAQSDLQNARKTLQRQRDLRTRGATSDSQRDDALNRVRIAEATLREATARLARARRDLSRTEIRAPYDGRVRSERVDVGQFVRRGNSVGTIYAVDYAEVRLPLQDEELAFLNLPLAGSQASAASAAVMLRARFAGAEHTWEGEVVRTEGELDPQTRMVHVVARVAEPYTPQAGRPPLSVGLFVNAEIMGSTVPNLVRLPRTAIRGDSRVLIVDNESRLRYRDVTVLRREQDTVLVSSGLIRGDWVCISALQATAEGMLVRVSEEGSAGLAATQSEEPTT